jgi:acyl-CoA thioester hydrolase
MRHRYECPMRWADLDLLGHVNNVVYVDYLQEARVDMMRTHAPDSRSDDLAEGVVVVRSEVSYRSPLRFRFRPVSIESWVTELRAASFTMAYEVFDEHEGERTTYLRARTVLTPYVFATERPRRLTADERDGLLPFLEPDGILARPAPGGSSAPQSRGHRYPVQVRFSDVDVYGHVNNVKYFEYFQEGRIELLDRVRREAPPETPRAHLVVAQTDVDYRVPILFRPEPYDQWSRIARVGTTSMTVESEICDEDLVLSRARVVVVFWDPDTGRPVEPSDPERALLLAEL